MATIINIKDSQGNNILLSPGDSIILPDIESGPDGIVSKSGATLRQSFDMNDVAGGSLLIGSVDENIIFTVIVTIETVFDNTTTCTIGDSGAQGRLMDASENNMSLQESYQTFHSYRYETETDLYVYFPTGTPTQGSGHVTIYYY